MGREIRMVPPNWEHPKYTKDNAPNKNQIGQYIPMHDRDYETELQEWWDERQLWKEGKHETQLIDSQRDDPFYPPGTPYEDYAGTAPDPVYYRPTFTEEPTWYQVYQNVSEGTPLTPPFATKEELVEHLCTVGDDWDGPVSKEAAEKFVDSGYVPSMVLVPGRGILSGIESAVLD